MERKPDVLIEIDRLPPSKNQYQRKHWTAQRAEYESWYQYMAILDYEHNYPRITGKVHIEIEFHFPDRRRRDVMNFSAFPPLIDALTMPTDGKRRKPGLGIIQDDDSTHCRIEIAEPIVDGTAQTVIRIWAVTPERGDEG